MTGDAPVREPMRPRGTRRMRKPGRRAPRPFRPSVETVLRAADEGYLRRNRHGRYIDARGLPVCDARLRGVRLGQLAHVSGSRATAEGREGAGR